MLWQLHVYLLDFAAQHNLRPQIELTRTHVVLVIGSASQGRVELDAIEIGEILTWGDVDDELDKRRSAWRERVRAGLVKNREVDGGEYN